MKSLTFNGNGTEYFKIWIVNILLTIVTLGLYYPWAKVRSRRYFYGNTELDNANFEYHATGKQLFVSYLIAMMLFIVYIISSRAFPLLSGILAIVLFLAFPWIIWRSLKFNFRMTSYRNVRFGFNGSMGRSYAVFMGYPIMMVIAFFIVMLITGALSSIGGMKAIASILVVIMILSAYPAFIAMMSKLKHSYIINGAHFGQGQFITYLEFKPFSFIVLKAMALAILLSFFALIVAGLLAYFVVGPDQIIALGDQMKDMEQGAKPDTLFFILIFSIYAFLIPVSLYIIAYVTTKNRYYIFDNTTLDNKIKFESTLATNKLFGITLTNLILIILTLGLAYPWTKVRAFRYLTETIEVEASQGFDGYISQQANEGAFGEELGDAFDIDVGGIAF